MIHRIVKMTFAPGKEDEFLAIFRESGPQIALFPGCKGVRLLRCDQVFFTYSLWENDQALQEYRASELFKQTWTSTKALFAAAPEAWSTFLTAEEGIHTETMYN